MTVSVGQIGTFASGSSSTQPFVFATLPSAGSRVLLSDVSIGVTSGTGTATDNQGVGNTYTNTLNSVVAAAGIVCALECSAIGTPSGTFTVTANNLFSQYEGALIELHGTNSVAVGTPAANGGATSSSFAASVTAGAASTVNDSIAVAWLAFNSNGSSPNWSTPAGFTNAVLNTSGGVLYRMDYKILTATETTTANWGSALTDQGLGGSWFAGIVVYSGSGVSGDILMGQACL